MTRDLQQGQLLVRYCSTHQKRHRIGGKDCAQRQALLFWHSHGFSRKNIAYTAFPA